MIPYLNTKTDRWHAGYPSTSATWAQGYYSNGVFKEGERQVPTKIVISIAQDNNKNYLYGSDLKNSPFVPIITNGAYENIYIVGVSAVVPCAYFTSGIQVTSDITTPFSFTPYISASNLIDKHPYSWCVMLSGKIIPAGHTHTLGTYKDPGFDSIKYPNGYLGKIDTNKYIGVYSNGVFSRGKKIIPSTLILNNPLTVDEELTLKITSTPLGSRLRAIEMYVYGFRPGGYVPQFMPSVSAQVHYIIPVSYPRWLAFTVLPRTGWENTENVIIRMVSKLKSSTRIVSDATANALQYPSASYTGLNWDGNYNYTDDSRDYRVEDEFEATMTFGHFVSGRRVNAVGAYSQAPLNYLVPGNYRREDNGKGGTYNPDVGGVWGGWDTGRVYCVYITTANTSTRNFSQYGILCSELYTVLWLDPTNWTITRSSNPDVHYKAGFHWPLKLSETISVDHSSLSADKPYKPFTYNTLINTRLDFSLTPSVTGSVSVCYGYAIGSVINNKVKVDTTSSLAAFGTVDVSHLTLSGAATTVRAGVSYYTPRITHYFSQFLSEYGSTRPPGDTSDPPLYVHQRVYNRLHLFKINVFPRSLKPPAISSVNINDGGASLWLVLGYDENLNTRMYYGTRFSRASSSNQLFVEFQPNTTISNSLPYQIFYEAEDTGRLTCSVDTITTKVTSVALSGGLFIFDKVNPGAFYDILSSDTNNRRRYNVNTYTTPLYIENTVPVTYTTPPIGVPVKSVNNNLYYTYNTNPDNDLFTAMHIAGKTPIIMEDIFLNTEIPIKKSAYQLTNGWYSSLSTLFVNGVPLAINSGFSNNQSMFNERAIYYDSGDPYAWSESMLLIDMSKSDQLNINDTDYTYYSRKGTDVSKANGPGLDMALGYFKSAYNTTRPSLNAIRYHQELPDILYYNEGKISRAPKINAIEASNLDYRLLDYLPPRNRTLNDLLELNTAVSALPLQQVMDVLFDTCTTTPAASSVAFIISKLPQEKQNIYLNTVAQRNSFTGNGDGVIGIDGETYIDGLLWNVGINMGSIGLSGYYSIGFINPTTGLRRQGYWWESQHVAKDNGILYDYRFYPPLLTENTSTSVVTRELAVGEPPTEWTDPADAWLSELYGYKVTMWDDHPYLENGLLYKNGRPYTGTMRRSLVEEWSYTPLVSSFNEVIGYFNMYGVVDYDVHNIQNDRFYICSGGGTFTWPSLEADFAKYNSLWAVKVADLPAGDGQCSRLVNPVFNENFQLVQNNPGDWQGELVDSPSWDGPSDALKPNLSWKPTTHPVYGTKRVCNANENWQAPLEPTPGWSGSGEFVNTPGWTPSTWIEDPEWTPPPGPDAETPELVEDENWDSGPYNRPRTLGDGLHYTTPTVTPPVRQPGNGLILDTTPTALNGGLQPADATEANGGLQRAERSEGNDGIVCVDVPSETIVGYSTDEPSLDNGGLTDNLAPTTSNGGKVYSTAVDRTQANGGLVYVVPTVENGGYSAAYMEDYPCEWYPARTQYRYLQAGDTVSFANLLSTQLTTWVETRGKEEYEMAILQLMNGIYWDDTSKLQVQRGYYYIQPRPPGFPDEKIYFGQTVPWYIGLGTPMPMSWPMQFSSFPNNLVVDAVTQSIYIKLRTLTQPVTKLLYLNPGVVYGLRDGALQENWYTEPELIIPTYNKGDTWNNIGNSWLKQEWVDYVFDPSDGHILVDAHLHTTYLSAVSGIVTDIVDYPDGDIRYAKINGYYTKAYPQVITVVSVTADEAGSFEQSLSSTTYWNSYVARIDSSVYYSNSYGNSYGYITPEGYYRSGSIPDFNCVYLLRHTASVLDLHRYYNNVYYINGVLVNEDGGPNEHIPRWQALPYNIPTSFSYGNPSYSDSTWPFKNQAIKAIDTHLWYIYPCLNARPVKAHGAVVNSEDQRYYEFFNGHRSNNSLNIPLTTINDTNYSFVSGIRIYLGENTETNISLPKTYQRIDYTYSGVFDKWYTWNTTPTSAVSGVYFNDNTLSTVYKINDNTLTVCSSADYALAVYNDDLTKSVGLFGDNELYIALSGKRELITNATFSLPIVNKTDQNIYTILSGVLIPYTTTTPITQVAQVASNSYTGQLIDFLLIDNKNRSYLCTRGKLTLANGRFNNVSYIDGVKQIVSSGVALGVPVYILPISGEGTSFEPYWLSGGVIETLTQPASSVIYTLTLKDNTLFTGWIQGNPSISAYHFTAGKLDTGDVLSGPGSSYKAPYIIQKEVTAHIGVSADLLYTLCHSISFAKQYNVIQGEEIPFTGYISNNIFTIRLVRGVWDTTVGYTYPFLPDVYYQPIDLNTTTLSVVLSAGNGTASIPYRAIDPGWEHVIADNLDQENKKILTHQDTPVTGWVELTSLNASYHFTQGVHDTGDMSSDLPGSTYNNPYIIQQGVTLYSGVSADKIYMICNVAPYAVTLDVSGGEIPFTGYISNTVYTIHVTRGIWDNQEQNATPWFPAIYYKPLISSGGNGTTSDPYTIPSRVVERYLNSNTSLNLSGTPVTGWIRSTKWNVDKDAYHFTDGWFDAGDPLSGIGSYSSPLKIQPDFNICNARDIIAYAYTTGRYNISVSSICPSCDNPFTGWVYNTYNIAHIKRNTFNSDVSTVSAMFIPDNNWRALHCT